MEEQDKNQDNKNVEEKKDNNVNSFSLFHNLPCKIDYTGVVKSDKYFMVTKGIIFTNVLI